MNSSIKSIFHLFRVRLTWHLPKLVDMLLYFKYSDAWKFSTTSAECFMWNKCYINCILYLNCNLILKSDVSVLCKMLIKTFRIFQDLALQLLNECHNRNEIFTKHLLTRNFYNWGDQTCFGIAGKSNHSEFIAHTSCQDILSCQWNGDLKISQSSAWIVRDKWLFLCSISW